MKLGNDDDWSALEASEALRRWLALCDAFGAFTEQLQAVKSKGTPRERVEHLREWWGQVEILMGAYLLLSRRGLHARLPENLVNGLRRLSGGLAVGEVSSAVTDVVMAGARGRGPQERDAVIVAAAYVGLAKEQRIADRTPIKSVGEAYKVSRRTVQNWVDEAVSLSPSRPLPDDPHYIAVAMRQMGEWYRKRPAQRPKRWRS